MLRKANAAIAAHDAYTPKSPSPLRTFPTNSNWTPVEREGRERTLNRPSGLQLVDHSVRRVESVTTV